MSDCDCSGMTEKELYEKEKPKLQVKYCKYCCKALVPVGSSRRNGTFRHDDWIGRQYHKKCFKIVCSKPV